MGKETTLAEEIEKIVGIPFSEEQKEELNLAARQIVYKKGQIIVKEGEVTTAVHVILSGLVRGYYIDSEGKEVTKCFAKEGEFFSTECFRTGGVSTFYIESLEDCRCINIPNIVLQKLMEKDYRFLAWLDYLSQQVLYKQELRTKELLLSPASKRYVSFLQEYNTLSERISKKYIASYIGVQPESLSRIIKKCKKENMT